MLLVLLWASFYSMFLFIWRFSLLQDSIRSFFLFDSLSARTEYMMIYIQSTMMTLVTRAAVYVTFIKFMTLLLYLLNKLWYKMILSNAFATSLSMNSCVLCDSLQQRNIEHTLLVIQLLFMCVFIPVHPVNFYLFLKFSFYETLYEIFHSETIVTKLFGEKCSEFLFYLSNSLFYSCFNRF